MGRREGKAQASGVQAMVVKLMVSFGLVLWMFLVATLSHV